MAVMMLRGYSVGQADDDYAGDDADAADGP